MSPHVFILSFILILFYALMWWFLVVWYKDAKANPTRKFRAGIIFTKQQCREEISKERTMCISTMIATILFTLFIVEQFGHGLNLIPQDFNLFGYVFATLGIIGLLIMLCRFLGFPLFSLLLLVILLPFGGSHHSYWRNHIRHW